MFELTQEIRDKRVAIAKDVIYQLEEQMYRATKGHYVTLPNTPITSINKIEGQLQEHLGKIMGADCCVCAIGAMFLSKVNLYNECKMEELGFAAHDGGTGFFDTQMRQNLEEIFDHEFLNQVESCFEGWGDKGYKLYQDNPDNYQRMILIMQNIIENNGELMI